MSPHSQNRTFYPFIRLPFELRLMVWERILHRPHLVEVFTHQEYEGRLLREGSHLAFYPVFQIQESDRSPIILRICKESRELGLRSYEICLGTTIDPAVRFSMRRDDGGIRTVYNLRERMSIILERLASSLLPSPVNAERIRSKHAKFVSKGIFFQPGVDTIWFRRISGQNLFGLLPSVLKTDNIRVIAMNYKLIMKGTPVFQYLLVPTYFKPHGLRNATGNLWPNAVEESEIPLKNLKRLIVVIQYILDASAREKSRGSVMRRLKAMVETKGVGGNLLIVVKDVPELQGDTL